MGRLNQLAIRFSQSGWLFLLAMLVAFGSLFAVLLPIGRVFPEVAGGAVPFDLQNALTAGDVISQLAGYTESARQLYYAFAFADFFFPFFASLFLAALAAFSLRHVSAKWYAVACDKNLFSLFFLGALFDWLENLLALAVISSYPETSETMANLLVLAKKGKLAMVMIGQPIAWLLLAIAILKWVGRTVGLVKN